jgi:hypothetical protein
MRPAPRIIDDLCKQADPASDIEHFVVCPVCGQIFDCRDERQARHLVDTVHDPFIG